MKDVGGAGFAEVWILVTEVSLVREQSGRWRFPEPHKDGVGTLFPDLRLVESTSPYPTMN